MKVSVRTTKKFLNGSLKDMVITTVFEVANEESARRTIKDCPKGRIIGGGWFGPKAEVLEIDYIVEA